MFDSLTAGALTLFNTTDQTSFDTTGSTFDWNSDTNTATWELSSLALTDGTYSVGLSAATIRNSAGISLDGNGDGNAGDDFQLSLDVSTEAVIEFLAIWTTTVMWTLPTSKFLVHSLATRANLLETLTWMTTERSDLRTS